ncbi:MAG: type II toxin-antitoxin system VapC family toxin [Thermomicrobiales bacterium]|nr:type II toxin-antitoxin system VapC family toxin [Thermomicrobiales bacterium]
MVKIILDEEQSDLARSLYDALLLNRTTIIAPPLLPIEMTNVFRKRTRLQNGLSIGEAGALLDLVLSLPITIQNPPGLHRRALVLANALGLPATYDAHYLALAEFMACEFWTADLRLARQTRDRLPFVRWLGDHAMPTG